MQKSINGSIFRKMIIASASLLEQNKKLVDSLNVFPVPDGDTGTNMFLTIKSASVEVNNCINNNMIHYVRHILKALLEVRVETLELLLHKF
jgi:dihydroxyacetone kinase-like predicted kinase